MTGKKEVRRERFFFFSSGCRSLFYDLIRCITSLQPLYLLRGQSVTPLIPSSPVSNTQITVQCSAVLQQSRPQPQKYPQLWLNNSRKQKYQSIRRVKFAALFVIESTFSLFFFFAGRGQGRVYLHSGCVRFLYSVILCTRCLKHK